MIHPEGRSSDKSVVDQRLEPLQNKDCLSLSQNDSGTEPIINVETVEVPQGQGDCPNDKLTVVPATKPAPGQDCASLGQTGSGTEPIIDVETVKQAEMDQRQKWKWISD